MFIAHAPAGYLLSTFLHQRWPLLCTVPSHAVVLAGIAGAVAPDLDMLYFHLVDQRQQHHHAYFTHFPILWTGLLLAAAVWAAFNQAFDKDKTAPLLTLVFALNGLLHMALDSVAGDLRWLAPFDHSAFSLVTVPARHQPWLLNFVLHWSFLLELALLVWAVLRWRARASARASAGASTRP